MKNDDSVFQDVCCALCGCGVGYRVLYPARLDYAGIDLQQLFSARRIPGRIHFRIVVCEKCGLVYSNPILSEETIYRLYSESEFIDDPFLKKQFVNIQKDYAKHLKRAMAYLRSVDNLLDVGCGDGFFLKIAKEYGFGNVKGVEPGKNACVKADINVSPCIVQGVFHKKLFGENIFDIVSFFHVLDHILHPNDFLKDVWSVLKPGGIALAVMHNVRFVVTRLAGEFAPMFHIEHVYLFDKKTVRIIFERNGFEVLEIEDLVCTYTLAHTIKMIPLPFKKMFLRMLEGKRMADMKISLSPGDMLLIARKR